MLRKEVKELFDEYNIDNYKIENNNIIFIYDTVEFVIYPDNTWEQVDTADISFRFRNRPLDEMKYYFDLYVRQKNEGRMIVKDIFNMNLPTLIAQTDTAIGTEKYAKYVIYDKNGIVANGLDDISKELINSYVQDYSVEPDPDDTETLLVRIDIQDTLMSLIDRMRKGISDNNRRTPEEYQKIINEYRKEKYGKSKTHQNN